MIHNYVTYKHTLQSIISKLGLRNVNYLPYDDMIDWISEALSSIGGYSQLEDATIDIVVDDYKGKFPLDMYCPIELVNHKMDSQPSLFVTDIRTGTVTLKYKRFPVDEEGFPLIPDSNEYALAIMWYVAGFLSMQGLLPNKQLNYAYCNSMWQRYCLGARAESITPTNDQFDKAVASFRRERLVDNTINRENTLPDVAVMDLSKLHYKIGD